MNKNVGIIIVNFSGTGDTIACLDSLRHVEADKEIYVVHFTPNGGAQQIGEHPIKPVVIECDENLGFAGFNNVGLKKAIMDGCDPLVLLNNDTRVEPNFLVPLLNRLGTSEVGLVSPKIYFEKGFETHDYPEADRGKVIWYGGGVIDWNNMFTFHKHVDELDRGQADEAVQTDFATGCCVALSKTTYELIGPVPEDYFIYLEDVAWSLQACKRGLAAWFEPASIIWHKNAQSTGGSGSSTHVYYQTRNRILFAMRYAPLRIKVAILREAMKDIKCSDMAKSLGAKHGLMGKSGMINTKKILK
jgi:GT2 family glycosyltransferase